MDSYLPSKSWMLKEEGAFTIRRGGRRSGEDRGEVLEGDRVARRVRRPKESQETGSQIGILADVLQLS